MLLCTDLDRTLLPNGDAPESPGARDRFARLVARPEINLVYVSGRHLASVEAAIGEYGLPYPDYAICDVGTTIYQGAGARDMDPAARASSVGDWKLLESWSARLGEAWLGDLPETASPLLGDLPGLIPQEEESQSRFKLSFYVMPASEDPQALLDAVRRRLSHGGLDATVIYSTDEPNGRGLLDLLPPGAGKLGAIEHLLRQRGLSNGDAFFAGDSGNDLEVLASSIPAALVANASEALREQAVELAQRTGNASRLHLARGGFHGMNGNYAGGILEGLAHFRPESEAWWT
jgi:hypothetical protein